MNILIVSPAYPPFSGVGSLRMNSLSKYLKNNGERPIILRNKPTYWGKENLKTEVPKEIEIIDVDVCSSIKKNTQRYYHAISEVLKSGKIDIIIYSVGPYFTLEIAPKISKVFNVKYIIDFRDLWVFENLGNRGIVKNTTHYLLMLMNRYSEKKAVMRANKIIVVTPGDKKIMQRHYRNQKDKIEIIFNGFEEQLINYDDTIETNVKHTISTFGKFGYYAPNFAELLFEAIISVKSFGIDVLIQHIGAEEKYINELIVRKKYPEEIYSCTGYVNYEAGVEMTKKADVNFIIYKHPTGLGTKIFDYIACNKPIILVTDQAQALSQFVKSFKNGYVCKDKDGIIETIKHIIENDISTLDEKNRINLYSRKFQNKIYHELINEIAY